MPTQPIVRPREQRFAAKAILRLVDCRGMQVAVRSGSAWLTQQADGRDIILEPGQAFEIDRNGATLIQMLSDCTLAFVPPSQPAKSARALARRQAIARAAGRVYLNPTLGA